MKSIHRKLCPTLGTQLKLRKPNDGTETKLAYCQHCGRYYGRVMNDERRQFRGFHPANARSNHVPNL